MGGASTVVSLLGVLAQADATRPTQHASVLPIVLEAIVGAALLGAGAWQVRRRQQIAAVAQRLGYPYSDDDPFGCARGPLEFLHRGDRQEVHAVLTRPGPDPLHTKVFDFRWFTESRRLGADAKGSANPGHGASCVTAIVNGAFPHLRVAPVGIGSELRDVVLDDKIDLESDEFNQTFDVTCKDRRFAVAFLDAPMQQLLLDSMRGLCLEVQGGWLLIHGKPLPPKAVPGLFGLMDRVVTTIPSVVNALNPSPLGPDLHTPMPDPYAATLQTPLLSEFDDPDEATHGEDSFWSGSSIRDPSGGSEYDLDGHVVQPHAENPWGPARPFVHDPHLRHDPTGQE